ncbi:hypothetical protein [Streptomyces sp. NPDC020141]|uniref:hypothetical protein n=1 Tax=Streptomyces sp. NPDC020141 TaxID=3365065 RepID=UPI00378A52E4
MYDVIAMPPPSGRPDLDPAPHRAVNAHRAVGAGSDVSVNSVGRLNSAVDASPSTTPEIEPGVERVR